MQLLLRHLHFDNFSKNRAVNLESLKDDSDTNFIRKGFQTITLMPIKFVTFQLLFR